MPSCLPHGAYSLFPAVLCTLAWLASLSQDGCDYSSVSGSVVQQIAKNKDVPFVEIGFVAYREPTYNEEDKTWNVAYTGACATYDPDLEDSFWKAAKGFAFGALVLGGASSLFLWFSTCFIFSRGTWRWAGYQVVLAFICQALAFLWFGTAICKDEDNSCDLFYGSKADIAASVLWFASAVLIFARYPKPQLKPEERTENGSEPSIEVQDAPEMEVPVEGDAGATLPPPPGDQVIDQRLTDVDII
eukprot:CAMPEP_0119015100 /NCGR_PEP_ID=MMETSP1176-20130426/10559_1 /TAXON_ID=265551 /ORGANISM="Synedropsis recta cf, Strain CCMP1620" /LENGTH=244 /DNA_ID=CAMNT_0006968367 /DNA_START=191 /DNA_END=925 /DNA_ORIENTATION=-